MSQIQLFYNDQLGYTVKEILTNYFTIKLSFRNVNHCVYIWTWNGRCHLSTWNTQSIMPAWHFNGISSILVSVCVNEAVKMYTGQSLPVLGFQVTARSGNNHSNKIMTPNFRNGVINIYIFVELKQYHFPLTYTWWWQTLGSAERSIEWDVFYYSIKIFYCYCFGYMKVPKHELVERIIYFMFASSCTKDRDAKSIKLFLTEFRQWLTIHKITIFLWRVSCFNVIK